MKLFATVEELQNFTGVYPEDGNSQQELFISSATDIIINYLGYDPSKQLRQEISDGTGDSWLFLNSKPVTNVVRLKINGSVISPDKYYIKPSSICLKEGTFPKGIQNISIEYESGYEQLPNVIKLTCLRIAALLQNEANDNIGITSKSFGDSGSRTFYNFTNFNKYLSQLSSYQIF